MKPDPFDIRGWSAGTRLLLWLILCVSIPILICLLVNGIDLRLKETWGALNLAGVSILLAWFLIDALFDRSEFYNAFGRTEGVLKHAVRFWRRVALLLLVVLALGSALLVYTAPPGIDGALTKETAGSIAILAGAFLASFGWMYTRYEQEKADRAAATLLAIRDQMYGGRIANIYRLLSMLSSYCVQKMKAPSDRPFNQDELQIRTEDVVHDIEAGGRDSYTHAEVADQFINALNQLAYGVRQGQFDLDTIKYVLRPRFIRIAFRYHEQIIESTRAEDDVAYDRMRAKKRTWEHFLWLTSKIEVLATDNVDHKHIVMPPDHKFGILEGEEIAMPGPIRLIPEHEKSLLSRIAHEIDAMSY